MKKTLALLILIALIILINLIFQNSRAESGSPPSSGGESFGDWVIRNKDNILRENQEIILKGNLTIEKGGRLTFKNVTLIMNCSFDGQYNITVEEGGSFYIYDFDFNSSTINDSSKITAYNNNFEYGFLVEKNALFEMKNSELHECGDNTTSKGLTIKSKNVLIENSTISNNYYGIYCFSSYSSPKIYNNTISNNNYGIYNYMGASPKIKNNSIFDNNYGILSTWKIDIEIIDCKIENNKNYGISIKDSDVKLLNCNFSNNEVAIKCSRSEPKFINCTIEGKKYDFYFEGQTKATSLNTTFDENKIYLKTSELKVQWYLNVRTVNQNGRPIAGVIVQVQGNESAFQDFHKTDEEGFVKGIVCTEYALSKNEKILYNPYMITAVKEKKDGKPDVKQFYENITSSKTIYVEYVTVNITIFCTDNVHNVKKGTTTSFTITITNNGEDTETIHFQLFSFYIHLANLTKKEITLTPGESITLNLLTVTVPKDAETGDEYEIRVIALVENNTVGSVATYTYVEGKDEEKGELNQIFIYILAILVLSVVFYLVIFVFTKTKKI